MDLKKLLYDLHRFTSPSPRALKIAAPLVMAPLAYYGHKYITGKLANGIHDVARFTGSPMLDDVARNIKYKSKPLWFSAAATALTIAATQAMYDTNDTDPRRQDNWKNFFYGVDKKASLMDQSAGLQQGWAEDALAGTDVKRRAWLTPSVNSRELKETIWDTPGFTPGQKTFMRDSVDGAMDASDDGSYISKNDLGIGAQKAIVNYSTKVPGLLPTALKATALASQGAFLGYSIGTLLGGSRKTRNVMAGTGLAASVINSSGVMKKIGDAF